MVRRLETRLIDGEGKPIADSGSAIVLVNGGYQVSYEKVPALDASRPGDGVRICLVSVPKDCPKGDHRGKIYKTTNLRTHGDWTLPDAEHSLRRRVRAGFLRLSIAHDPRVRGFFIRGCSRPRSRR